MTPEELNRAMEFIIEHQAHLSASLDREQETRAAQFERLANLSAQVVDLIKIESERLDRQDEMLRDSRKLYERSQKETREQFQQIVELLDRIFKKLAKDD